jgi:glycosyltransferase involved in cell wall biosynthesis
MDDPRFSVVIPAHNEARYLPPLVDSLDRARRRLPGGAGEVEVIVADNGSDDGTAAIAAQHGCRVVPVERRVIAAARNGGARAARGEILCFVDADMRIHPDTFLAIEPVMASPRTVGGATGVTLERWSLGLACTYAMFLPMVWLTGMDTGVVFCRRADFEAIGGYDERRPIAEDVVFLWALRRLGRARGARLVRLTAAKAVASTRKFDRYGDWHYFTRVLPRALAAGFRPTRMQEMIDEYWYRDRS